MEPRWTGAGYMTALAAHGLSCRPTLFSVGAIGLAVGPRQVGQVSRQGLADYARASDTGRLVWRSPAVKDGCSRASFRLTVSPGFAITW